MTSKDQMFGLRWHFAYELIDVTLAWADGAQVGDRSAVILSHISNRDGLFRTSMPMKSVRDCDMVDLRVER